MPHWVVGKVTDALNRRGKSVMGSRVLVLGIAYKKDVEDMRESPSVELMEILREKGAVLVGHEVPDIAAPRRSVFGETKTPLYRAFALMPARGLGHCQPLKKERPCTNRRAALLDPLSSGGRRASAIRCFRAASRRAGLSDR